MLVGKAPNDVPGDTSRTIVIPTLSRLRFVLIPYRRWTGVARIDDLRNGFTQLRYVTHAIHAMRAQFLVCDRSNLPLAAWFAWLGQAVVVRMLGVGRLHMFWATPRNALLHPLRYFAIRAPFAAIVCSEDGSPGTETLARYAKRTMHHRVWLNGVAGVTGERRSPKRLRHNGPPRLLFVSRLEPDKGVPEFVAALARVAVHEQANRFTARIVGDGSLRSALEESIRNYGLRDRVTITGAVPHDAMAREYAWADVFVSLNAIGNLSNAVLEAMSAGKCIVMLGPDPASHTDEATTRLVPDDVVIRINRTRVVGHLVEELKRLLDHPEAMSGYEERMRSFAGEFLWSWEDRVGYEERLFEQILARGSAHLVSSL